MRKIFLLPLSTVLFFTLDQISKFLVRHYLERVGDVRVIGDFLRFHLVYNYHGIFGFSFGDGILFRYLLPIAGIIFVLFMAVRAKSQFFVYGLLLGGALGNIFDRILFGRVTDFIDVGIGRWRWYTFNLADAFLVIGILLVFFLPRRE